MIGRILCRLGRHTGQAEGALAMYRCPRCDGHFWQTDPDMPHGQAAIRTADHLLARGDHEGANAALRAGGREDLIQEPGNRWTV